MFFLTVQKNIVHLDRGRRGSESGLVHLGAQMQRTGNVGAQLAFCISPWVFPGNAQTHPEVSFIDARSVS